ncbi:methionine ABC transporter membrane-anchored lipoprotein MetQ, partial [Vibrio parahaemolyticus]|nr:methionine ABC transporter membrane-anchored lipoprotein MetQ [Vibrio parahaemolyticus]
MKFSLKGLLTIIAAASTLVLAGCGEKATDTSKV